jgi:hypothetical protein
VTSPAEPAQDGRRRPTDRRLVVGITLAVLAIWLVGAAVTRYTLGQMAILAPIAVVVVGLTIGIVMLWVKIVLQLRAERRAR